MPPERLTPGQWMHNTKELREHLAKVFSVEQSKATEVRDQDIVSDGRSYDDLAVITLAKMEEYIGSKETFARAWEITCSKGWSELHPPMGTIQPVAAKTVTEIPGDEPAAFAEPAALQMDALTEEDIANSTHGKQKTTGK